MYLFMFTVYCILTHCTLVTLLYRFAAVFLPLLPCILKIHLLTASNICRSGWGGMHMLRSTRSALLPKRAGHWADRPRWGGAHMLRSGRPDPAMQQQQNEDDDTIDGQTK